MKINAATKIATLLKYDPRAMEVIISVSPKFEKLRNPLLRRLFAGRTSIAMASRIGGCEVADFFGRLEQLGFVSEGQKETNAAPSMSPPAFLVGLNPMDIRELDVRPILEADADPLKMIMDHLKKLSGSQVLKIINSFEPGPLIALASKKGYGTYVKHFDSELVETYIYKEGLEQEPLLEKAVVKDDWKEVYNRFQGNMVHLDVRHLPMPKPMVAILEALEGLAFGRALFVLHKKVPLFLLPELKEKGYYYKFKEIAENEVHLLIFREENEG